MIKLDIYYSKLCYINDFPRYFFSLYLRNVAISAIAFIWSLLVFWPNTDPNFAVSLLFRLILFFIILRLFNLWLQMYLFHLIIRNINYILTFSSPDSWVECLNINKIVLDHHSFLWRQFKYSIYAKLEKILICLLINSLIWIHYFQYLKLF